VNNLHEKSLIAGECGLNYQKHKGKKDLVFSIYTGFSIVIEVQAAGGYYKIIGESGHSEKNFTSRLLQAIEI